MDWSKEVKLSHIFSYTILDADGNQRACPIYCTLLGTLTITQLNAISVALSAVLDAALDGQLVKGTLTLSMDLDSGIKIAPEVGSNVQETGLLTFQPTGTPYSFSLDFPAFAQAGFSGKEVDVAQTDVAALIDFLVTSASGFTGSDKYDNALVGAATGKKTFRKHRK